MGQANSSRERHKSGDIQPCSPGKDGQAFVFDKKPNKLLYQTSGEDEDYLNTKVCCGVITHLCYLFMILYLK